MGQAILECIAMGPNISNIPQIVYAVPYELPIAQVVHLHKLYLRRMSTQYSIHVLCINAVRHCLLEVISSDLLWHRCRRGAMVVSYEGFESRRGNV